MVSWGKSKSMKKIILPFLASLCFSCTKHTVEISDQVAISQSPPSLINKKTNGGASFCTSSCTNFVGYISESPGYDGSTTYGQFHLWISQPLPYDVVITIETRLNGTMVAMHYGNQFVIPAGQNNTPTISALEDTFCYGPSGTVLAHYTKNYTVHIISIDRYDNLTDLNSQYQLWPGTGSFTNDYYCYEPPKDGGGEGF